MKLIIVAGTPGSGKTSILIHVLKLLAEAGSRPSIIKIDCLYTDDDVRFRKLGIPVRVGLSKDVCPDHFTIYNTEAMLEWSASADSDCLVVETAGLCHRCAPYTKSCLGICVIDATCGPNTPMKVGPFLSTADVVVITKGDMISQAEREIFRERVLEMNPGCRIVNANGTTGQGATEIVGIIQKVGDIDMAEERLRHNAPLSVCTLCVGETRVGKAYHRGILRRIDGFETYLGE